MKPARTKPNTNPHDLTRDEMRLVRKAFRDALVTYLTDFDVDEFMLNHVILHMHADQDSDEAANKVAYQVDAAAGNVYSVADALAKHIAKFKI